MAPHAHRREALRRRARERRRRSDEDVEDEPLERAADAETLGAVALTDKAEQPRESPALRRRRQREPELGSDARVVAAGAGAVLGAGARAIDERVGDEGVALEGAGVVHVGGEEREAVAVEVDAERRRARHQRVQPQRELVAVDEQRVGDILL